MLRWAALVLVVSLVAVKLGDLSSGHTDLCDTPFVHGEEKWTAAVMGATGATGRHLIRELAELPQVSRVVALVRQRLTPEEVKAKFNVSEQAAPKVEQVVVDFERIEEYKAQLAGIDKAFCTLGSTRKKAGSAEAFRKIDRFYVTNAAKVLKEGGTKEFSLLTSAGSNKDSMLLYPQVKGEVEEDCKGLGFQRLSIFRPGLLITPREESRPMEAVFQAIYPDFILPENAKSTPVERLARSMALDFARKPRGAVEIYNTAQIRNCDVGAV